MPDLTTGDATRLLRFVANAGAIVDDQPFTGEFLVKLGELVHADWIGYSELDLVHRRPITNVEPPGREYDVPFPDPLFWSYVPEAHPVRMAHWRGHVGALKISDYLSRRELRRSRHYDYFRQFGTEHLLEVQITKSSWRPKVFSFDRFGGRDFTERDRLVLDLLQPHLTRLWREARTRRVLRAALGDLQAGKNEPHGVVLLSGAGLIEFASPAARRLLRRFFSDRKRRTLPPALVDWVESNGTEPLQRKLGDRTLTVEREKQTLLLREQGAREQLTPREQEVLSWVARGKTNAEIAEVLWVAPSTVRKHLENVYAKLGVNTRTAAAARFIGVLDAETA